MRVTIISMVLLVFGSFISADTVLTRFSAPIGYRQVKAPSGSFAEYLQSLPLKAANTHTLTYKGEVARTDVYTAAVVDMSVDNEDLQQCADAIMRLRGEYLYRQKKYDAIAFHFTSGFRCDYIHYAEGYRYHNDHWVFKVKKDYGYENFMRYMRLVFAYAGTLSLDKELNAVKNPNELKTGDVFIHGGSPGHCFIVMDVVENSQHKKQFLLAQSFMPAQNIQVLQYGSPWFSVDVKSDILYGELISPVYLKRFD
ncbi:MAG: hypothetical protein JWP44_711 [Mucilaginibacter sp.]|nr:hypothetical protein [Mucilaginibacter sp.]